MQAMGVVWIIVGAHRLDALATFRRPLAVLRVHAEAAERAAAGGVEAEAVGLLAGGGGLGGVDGRRVLAQQQEPHQGHAQQRHAQLAGLGRHRRRTCTGFDGIIGRDGNLMFILVNLAAWLWWRRWCSCKLFL